MKTLYWLQCGACGGDSMSLIDTVSPTFVDLLNIFDIKVLWHPSLTNVSSAQHDDVIDRIIEGKESLDILCVEGSIIRGPGGTGMFDTFRGRPKKDLVSALAHRSQVVIAVGTCSGFGGILGNTEVEATGLQFHRRDPGGFLGASFRSLADLPVINLPGCPCHPAALGSTLMALCSNVELSLNEFQSPLEWYGLLVHQGCVRNEYHEYRVEETDFGQKGCLFFHLGCKGPLTHGPCNKVLWGGRSCKTRIGAPCVGCTEPDFPQESPFFCTANIAGVPLELPDGVDRAHYMAYKSMAAAAAPQRLLRRETQV